MKPPGLANTSSNVLRLASSETSSRFCGANPQDCSQDPEHLRACLGVYYFSVNGCHDCLTCRREGAPTLESVSHRATLNRTRAGLHLSAG